MRCNYALNFGWFWLKSFFKHKKSPILGTIILTDYCNLSCKHCAVNNIDKNFQPYDAILKNIERADNSNICIYMAINNLNYETIEDVALLAKNNPNINSISFNFHTPYSGTENLILNPAQKKQAAKTIKRLITEKYPVFNLYTAIDYYLKNKWQDLVNIVSEKNKRYICGRCVDIEGLCEQCGYLFVVEFSLIFSATPKIILEMITTYFRYTQRSKK
jgi:MoaA/NifB/PqqE/SkfB family radical SAM enzyme